MYISDLFMSRLSVSMYLSRWPNGIYLNIQAQFYYRNYKIKVLSNNICYIQTGHGSQFQPLVVHYISHIYMYATMNGNFLEIKNPQV